MNNTHHYKKCMLLALTISTVAPAFATQSERLHPGCVDEALQDDRLPRVIDIDDCNSGFTKHPVKDYLGLVYYDRPDGRYGELRGGFGYERLQIENRVLFRTSDHAGGSGVFSSLLLAREATESGNKMLTDLRVFPAGDRCSGGIEWIGEGEDEFFVAISLTPAGISHVLAAKNDQLHHSDEAHERAKYAFGRPLTQQLTSCPSCCLGRAVYGLNANNDWRLDYLELDGVPANPGAALGSLYALLDQAGEVSEEGALIIDAASLESVVNTLMGKHHAPADTKRLQFWLRALGFYWVDSVDGIHGPRTKAAITAYREHYGIEPANTQGNPELSPKQIKKLVQRGLAARWPRLHPVDETGFDDTFQHFMNRLRAAVAARDVETVVALAKSDIILGLGGGGGHSDLRLYLGDESFWLELEKVLSLGTVRGAKNYYCLPYTACFSARSLIDDYYPYGTLIVIDPTAGLLNAPKAGAKTLRELDYDILTLERDRDFQSDEFYRVRHADGILGYARQAHLAWTIGRRLEIEQTDNGWRIHSIYSGD